jgi:hypothetical protein
LIRYRIHESNQTLAMAGVTDKNSYLKVRVEELIDRLMWLKKRFASDKALEREISDALRWAVARKENLEGKFHAKGTVWRYRRFSPLTSLFEIVMAGAPNPLFMKFVELKRKNIL